MRWAIVLLAIGSVLAAGLVAPPAGAAGTGTPTHIALVAPGSVGVGIDATLMGVLHNSTSNQGVPGATLAFYAQATFGWLPLGNGTTNAQGKAAVDFRPFEAGDVTIAVRFEGDGTYAPSNASQVLTVLPAAPAQPPLLPPDTVIALIVLSTVGAVWATYGIVAWQVLMIRSAAPAGTDPAGAPMRSKRRFKEEERMEETSKAPKSAPELSSKPNRSALTLAAVALVIGAIALVFAGVTALPKAPAYTPGTIELQIAIVPDLKGEGWDAWVPNELVVHKGDTVKVTVINADEMEHGFRISALAVNQAIPGATANATGAITPSVTVVTFTADQVGQFLIVCNVVCGDGHDSMTGTLVVLSG